MAFPVDYSDDWQWVDGVEDAVYSPPSGTPKNVKVKATELSYTELMGGVLSVAPGDRAFLVWRLSEPAKSEATLTLTDSGDSYTVIAAVERGDEAQQRIVCRKRL